MQGAGPCLGELLSLLPKHPQPKMWAKSPLHAGYSPFNGKDLLVLLLESSAPPTWGEVQAVPAEQHKEHTWSGITCPGLCPQPAQSPDRSNLSIQPQDVLKRATPRGHRAQIPAGFTLHLLLPEASKDLGPAASGAAAEPWKSRTAAPLLSLNCHTLVPLPGKQTFLQWTEREAEVTK